MRPASSQISPSLRLRSRRGRTIHGQAANGVVFRSESVLRLESNRVPYARHRPFKRSRYPLILMRRHILLFLALLAPFLLSMKAKTAGAEPTSVDIVHAHLYAVPTTGAPRLLKLPAIQMKPVKNAPSGAALTVKLENALGGESAQTGDYRVSRTTRTSSRFIQNGNTRSVLAHPNRAETLPIFVGNEQLSLVLCTPFPCKGKIAVEFLAREDSQEARYLAVIDCATGKSVWPPTRLIDSPPHVGLVWLDEQTVAGVAVGRIASYWTIWSAKTGQMLASGQESKRGKLYFIRNFINQDGRLFAVEENGIIRQVYGN